MVCRVLRLTSNMTRHDVRTHTPVAVNSSSTKVVTPNNEKASSAAASNEISQLHDHKDAQLSCQDAPPCYTDAIAVPLAAEVAPNKNNYYLHNPLK